MRIESTVISISWIPRECIEGLPKLPFALGITHYDAPPPEELDDLEELRARDGFRFANQLHGWIEIEGGRIRGYGQGGGGRIGSTTVRFGPTSLGFAPAPFPDRRPAPDVGETWVTFTQTAGGRTGLPAPRRVMHAPFVKISAPIAWTTLSLTLHADGRSGHRLLGASPFPRHWIYDGRGRLVQKTGLVRFKAWFEEAFGIDTPWGHEDSPALVMDAESQLERALSAGIMSDPTTKIMTLEAGGVLVEQGAHGDELFLLLDGIVSVEVDGVSVAHLGPGAIAGEFALLGDGRRSATLRSVTQCRVVVTSGHEIVREALEKLANTRRSHSDQGSAS